ncbi:MAG: carboxypeptidase-like regulatory domain-containing protein, partial [Bacteroidales bacterium]|nr:carboxypeptidase-like regulatory domain-containing protein [Bacteroidales bacterium]
MSRKMHLIRKFGICLVALFGCLLAQAQQGGRVGGHVTDTLGNPVDLVNVVMKEDPRKGTTTDENGHFVINLPSGREVVLLFSCVGYHTVEIPVRVRAGSNPPLNVRLVPKSRQLPPVVKTGERYTFNTGVEYMDARMISSLPAMNSGIEGMIKTFGLGVHSHDELSSQYNVRGGSYDENLIYVNGTEVFRPFLIRSGQQEGMSFINPDMVSAVRFSS